MKITAITLGDFRCYEDVEIEFTEPLNIIRGANHGGKTTLRQGLELAFTHRTDGTDPRGAGANDKIREGAAKAVIDVTLEGKQGLCLIHTTYGPNKQGRQQKFSDDDSGQGSSFERFMLANQDRFACVLDSEYFIRLDQKGQKAVLASLILPTASSFDAQMMALANVHLGHHRWDGNPVEIIDSVYQQAYDARRLEKAKLQGITVPTVPDKPMYTVAEIHAALAEARQKQQKEARRIAKPGGVQLGRAEKELEQAREDLKLAQNEYADASRDLQTEKALIPSGPSLTFLRKTAANRAKLDELTLKLQGIRSQMDEAAQMQRFYAALRQNPECPTCTQRIDQPFIDTRIAGARQDEEAAIEQERALLLQQKDLGDVGGAERSLTECEETKAKVLAIKRRLTCAEEDAKAAQTKIAGLEATLANLREAEGQPADTTALDELTAEITQQEHHLNAAVSYEAAVDLKAKAEHRLVVQGETVAALEALCDYFGPNGVKTELLAQHIDAFTQPVNRVLSAWGYSAVLSMDPYTFTVTTAAGRTLPLKELSGSEQLMFGVALQCAFAVQSRLRFVVVDRSDTFIDAERMRLFTCLQSMVTAGELDQAIVLVSDAREQAPASPGVAFFLAADGKVTRL